jgi:hypothetical protein
MFFIPYSRVMYYVFWMFWFRVLWCVERVIKSCMIGRAGRLERIKKMRNLYRRSAEVTKGTKT